MAKEPGSDFLPFALPDITEAEVEAVASTVRSGWLTTGPNAAAFETEFADFITGYGRESGVAAAPEAPLHAIAVNSATAGLHLALEALGIGRGDEVLVPTWTFTATAEVVRYLGATPVLVDIDAQSLNIDFSHAATLVNERTRAIMPVHFAGLPVNRELLERFAAKHSLAVVEDAAHAFPVKSSGVPVGLGASDAVVFSFYATKTIATGEGGMVLTRNENLARRMRTMRLHGINRDVFDRYTSTKPAWHYDVVAPGYKYNLPDTAAAMGRVQLGRALEMRDKRASIAARYNEAFASLPAQLPQAGPEGPDSHAWHLYVLRVAGRDRFIEEMARAGVGCSVHFIPLHLHPYWRDSLGVHPEDLAVASREFTRAVSLPAFSAMSPQQVSRVIEATGKLLV